MFDSPNKLASDVQKNMPLKLKSKFCSHDLACPLGFESLEELASIASLFLRFLAWPLETYHRHRAKFNTKEFLESAGLKTIKLLKDKDQKFLKKNDEKMRDEISLYLLSFFGGVWFLTKWCYYYCYVDGNDESFELFPGDYRMIKRRTGVFHLEPSVVDFSWQSSRPCKQVSL